LTEFASNLSHTRFRIVAVTALLVSKREQGRQRRASNQRCEVLNHPLRIRAIKKIVVELARVRTERVVVARFFTEIKCGAVSVVEKNSVGRALPQSEEKRNVLVKRIGGLLPPKRIGVPHGEREIAVVEGAALISEAEVMLVLWHRLPNAKRGTVKGSRVARLVLRDSTAIWGQKADPQRRAKNFD